MNISWAKKLFIIFRLSLTNSGSKKAAYLKSLHTFKQFGEHNFWYSRVVPTDMELISVHNNVKVATDVYFCTHDVMHNLFNDDPTAIEVRGGISDIVERLKYLIMYLLGQNQRLCME